MISKSQLDKISFIYSNLSDKSVFARYLLNQLHAFNSKKISKSELEEWLDSWVATAELDQDPNCSKRIKRAYKKIGLTTSKKISWDQFKQSVGL